MNKLLTLFVAATLSFSASADLVVIGNQSGPDSLSEKDVKKLFMGKKTKLPNGQEASIIEMQDGNSVRIAFHDIHTGRSEAQLQSAWSRLIFTGKAEAPVIVKSTDEMIKMVSENPSAIGYVDESVVNDSVKVLFKK